MPVTISGNGVITGVDAGTFDVPVVGDTGVPWEIPFADGGSVGSLAALSEDVADAVAAGLSAANVGIGTNVVQTVKTDTFTTTSTAEVAVTGMSVAITPSSDTSKVLVIVSLGHVDASSALMVNFRIYRGTVTPIQGNADGSRVRAAFSVRPTSNRGTPATFAYLDSPNSDVSQTYELRIASAASGTKLLNRTSSDTDENLFARLASTITAIEVAP